MSSLGDSERNIGLLPQSPTRTEPEARIPGPGPGLDAAMTEVAPRSHGSGIRLGVAAYKLRCHSACPSHYGALSRVAAWITDPPLAFRPGLPPALCRH